MNEIVANAFAIVAILLLIFAFFALLRMLTRGSERIVGVGDPRVLLETSEGLLIIEFRTSIGRVAFVFDKTAAESSWHCTKLMQCGALGELDAKTLRAALGLIGWSPPK